jgi:Domain of unknown function (DUF4352)
VSSPSPNQPTGWPTQPEPPKDRRARKVVIGLAAGLVFVLASAVVIGQTSGAEPNEPSAQTQTESTPSPDTTLPPDSSDPGELGVPEDEEIPEEPDPAPAGKVGDTATISEEGMTGNTNVADVTVEKLNTFQSTTDSFGDRSYPDHEWFVKVKIAVEAFDNGFEVNPYDFYIRGPDGARYEPNDGNAMWVESEPEFHSATLAGGEKYTGFIVLDVPSKHGEIVYSPGWSGSATAEWTF